MINLIKQDIKQWIYTNFVKPLLIELFYKIIASAADNDKPKQEPLRKTEVRSNDGAPGGNGNPWGAKERAADAAPAKSDKPRADDGVEAPSPAATVARTAPSEPVRAVEPVVKNSTADAPTPSPAKIADGPGVIDQWIAEARAETAREAREAAIPRAREGNDSSKRGSGRYAELRAMTGNDDAPTEQEIHARKVLTRYNAESTARQNAALARSKGETPIGGGVIDQWIAEAKAESAAEEAMRPQGRVRARGLEL